MRGLSATGSKVKGNAGQCPAFLIVQDEFGSFDKYIWQFVGGKPIVNAWKSMSEIPAQTNEGGTDEQVPGAARVPLCGSTICYAHMQATGMVNDHAVDCFRYQEL